MKEMAPSDSACPRCGTGLPADAKFCPACGYRAARLTPGQTLDGKYEILEKLAEGGMGEVYKARHIHLDEIRIIKVTKPDPLGEGHEPRRFQEEARIATLVRHPNVAALYDFSRLPDGSYYMVWEYIDGITLEAWLRRHGPLTASRALEVSTQVLAGLAEIHAQGIVHRDLSPDNIMLRETSQKALVAKIIDLGIAKRIAAETIHMTSTGMFLGKLKYCSPEQAGSLPSGQKVDGRSDLYSFGVVLYEMLTGKPPFEAQTPEGYLGKHLHTQAPPLDTTRLPLAVGPGFAAVTRRALEKDRDKRFATAQEFAAALGGLKSALTHSSEIAETTTLSPERRTSRYAWGLGGLIVLLIAAGLYIINRGARPSNTARFSSPSPIPLEETPRLTPTASPDDVVVAPRILEGTTPTPELPAAPPTHRAAAPSRPAMPPLPPTPPGAAPMPTAAAQAEPPPFRFPDGSELTARRLGHMVDTWTGKPLERRAEEAVRLAYMVRYWSKGHSGDPYSDQIRQTVIKALADDAQTARTNSRPMLEAKFLVAHLELEPTDEQALERLSEIQRRFPNRKGNGNPGN